jgi:TRAP-type uncharacterized transport system fused permease subunit
LHGFFLTRATLWQRALLAVGGLLLIFPALWTDIAAVFILSVVIAAQVLARRNETGIAKPEAVKPSLYT